MLHSDPKFIRAVGTMVGSVIGVGVFGLPFAFATSGPALGALVLILLAILVTGLQLMYARVALGTEAQHRLVGYVRKHLGENWGRFALAALAASLWGAMVAYMIVGGTFLKTIFSPVIGGSEFGYALVMALTAGLVMYRGIQFVSRFATVIVGILVFLFLFIILAALPHAEVSNLAGVHWEKFLLPYGVALFALSGMGIVPELKAVLGKRADRHLPCAVVVGMAVITALYLVFGLTVAAVLGPDTTAAAFDGLVPVLGSSFGVIAALLGSVTILSIFTIVGIELTNTFRYDFHVDPRAATLLAVGVPVVLFVAGIRELIEVLSFVGGVFGGALGILIVAMYEKTRPGPVRVTSWFVALVFAVGIIFTIVNSL